MPPAPLKVLALVVALGVTTRSTGSSGSRMPETIQPLSKHMLSMKRYKQLHQEWSAYTTTHPRDAQGWVQLGRAGNYAGVPCDDIVRAAMIRNPSGSIGECYSAHRPRETRRTSTPRGRTRPWS
jgi:hypothetical protein